MIQATKILHQGHGLAKALVNRAATVELGWDVRQQGRFECTDSHGRQLAVFLPPGSVVRGGDVLLVEDGTLVRVIAAPQAVMVVHHVGDRGTLFDLVRAAWHLGNRHVPVELAADHLKIEPDPALAELLRSMHLVVIDAFAPFEPEGTGPGGHAGHLHEDHHHGHHHGEPHPPEHEHDTQVHDHEHDSSRPGEHGES